jgi:hypothetical protein
MGFDLPFRIGRSRDNNVHIPGRRAGHLRHNNPSRGVDRTRVFRRYNRRVLSRPTDPIPSFAKRESRQQSHPFRAIVE